MNTQDKKSKHPIFNKEWEILGALGEGNTSKVYLVRHIQDGRTAALKLLREEFLQRDGDSIRSVEKEIQILQGLKHGNICNIFGYGSDGVVVKPSGRIIQNLVYLILEHISGGLLFDLCQTCGGMGEEQGRYFLNQLVDAMTYMNSRGVVHRDLKLENILVDEGINLKIADFGFATYKKIDKLTSYRGTKTYMAPEIKEGKTYDGRQIDIFSIGVIIFIIVQGIFPFKEAKRDEYYYNLLINGQIEKYWDKVGGKNLSPEFKDLMLRMFSYTPSKRPTIEEVKNHPWLKGPCDIKGCRHAIIEKVNEERSNRATIASEGAGTYRGDTLLELVREASATCLDQYKLNDNTDFDIDVEPGNIKDILENFNKEHFDSQFQIETNKEKQYIKLIKEDKNDKENDLIVKIRFYQTPSQDDEEDSQQLTRMRFIKKRGSLREWYDIFENIKEKGQLKDFLLITENQVPMVDELQ